VWLLRGSGSITRGHDFGLLVQAAARLLTRWTELDVTAATGGKPTDASAVVRSRHTAEAALHRDANAGRACRTAPLRNEPIRTRKPNSNAAGRSSLKADDGSPVPGKIRHGSMTYRSICHSAAMPIWEARNVQPVATVIYAGNAAICQVIHALFLLVRGPARTQSIVQDDEESRCRQAKKCGHVTRIRRRAPPRH
jgi:hypothetical protein